MRTHAAAPSHPPPSTQGSPPRGSTVRDVTLKSNFYYNFEYTKYFHALSKMYMYLGILGLRRAELGMLGERGRQPAHARDERRLEPRPQRERRALAQVVEARQIEVHLRFRNVNTCQIRLETSRGNHSTNVQFQGQISIFNGRSLDFN